MADSLGVALAIVVALVLAVGMGLVNGVLIGAFGMSPIVLTIATAQMWLGWALLETTTGPITPDTASYRDIGTADVGPLPLLAIIAIAALVSGHLVLTRTAFGRYVYATGGNETAARLAGVPVVRTKVLCYAVCGLFAGIAGVLLSSRVGSADATTGSQTMFAAYAAVFIGGVPWGGGAGTVLGAAIGVVLLGIVSNGLDLLALASPYQTIVAGLLIIIAIGLHRVRGGS
jgi:ribose/xylose/arabinose/galactoside ABC-type transport system permease subunit